MLKIQSITSNDVLDSEYKSQFKQYSNKDLYAILQNGEVIAYATFKIDNSIMWLNMIEVIAKGNGLGKDIIAFLFEYYSLDKIKGFVLCEERALRFWNKLGADIYYIDYEGYEIEEIIDAELESPFTYNG